MIWITGIICFAVGICAGAVLFKQLKTDTTRIKQLEEELDALHSEYDEYKENVHGHFNTTARLFHNLTDSYRDVYNHLAAGAQSLCPENISNQLSLIAENKDLLEDDSGDSAHAQETNRDFSPPRDYAAKSEPGQKGNLAEDYGLFRPGEENQH